MPEENHMMGNDEVILVNSLPTDVINTSENTEADNRADIVENKEETISDDHSEEMSQPDSFSDNQHENLSEEGSDENQQSNLDITDNVATLDELEKLPEINLDQILEDAIISSSKQDAKLNDIFAQDGPKRQKNKDKASKERKPDSPVKKGLKNIGTGVLNGLKTVAKAVALTVTFPIWIIPAGIKRLWDKITGKEILNLQAQALAASKEYAQANSPVIHIDSKAQEPEHSYQKPEFSNTMLPGTLEINRKMSTPTTDIKPIVNESIETTVSENHRSEAPKTADPLQYRNISEEEINNQLKQLFMRASKKPQVVELLDGSTLKFVAEGRKDKGDKHLSVVLTHPNGKTEVVYDKKQNGLNQQATIVGNYKAVKALISMQKEVIKLDEKPGVVQTVITDAEKCESIIKEAVKEVEKTGKPVILNLADKNDLEICPDPAGGYNILLKDALKDYSCLYGQSADGPDNHLILHGSFDDVMKATYPGIIIAEEKAPMEETEKHISTEVEPEEKLKAALDEQEPYIKDIVTDAFEQAEKGEKVVLPLPDGDKMVFAPVSLELDGASKNRVDVVILNSENCPTRFLLRNRINETPEGQQIIEKGSEADVRSFYQEKNASLDTLIENASVQKEPKAANNKVPIQANER
jgi:hypothetical protein